MSLKKKVLAVVAVSALTAATAVPAMAFENEFHGMFKMFGYQSNFFNGGAFNGGAAAGAHMKKDANSGFMAEQRARILYTAKASDDLKLVTHFELDSRFGGTTPYKGTTGSDAGTLDADALTLETKNVYLDFNALGTNFKTGLQPWADSYKSLFLLADMTGVYATKKFDPLTVSLGWFRFDDKDVAADQDPGKKTSDLLVADAKFAITKDLTVGANYYNVQRDSDIALGASGGYELLHVIGANAQAKFGPAAIDAFMGYEFGEKNATDDISAYILGATGKVKIGTTGAVNLAAIYLSGDDNTTGDTNGLPELRPSSQPISTLQTCGSWSVAAKGSTALPQFSATI